MTVSEFVTLLGQFDPDAWVVVTDDQEPELCNSREMRAEYVRPCAVKYIHFDRAPKFVAGEANAIAIGHRTPAVWVPPKY
jgi:hypothetical protein